MIAKDSAATSKKQESSSIRADKRDTAKVSNGKSILLGSTAGTSTVSKTQKNHLCAKWDAEKKFS